MTEANAFELLLAEVRELLSPLVEAGAGPAARRRLFEQLGWQVDAITGLPVGELDAALTAVSTSIERIAEAGDAPDFDAILNGLQAAGDGFTAIQAIVQKLNTGLPAIPVEALLVDMTNYLVLRYLDDRHPLAYSVMVLAALIEPAELVAMEPAANRPAPVVDPQSGGFVHDGAARARLRLDRLTRLLTDPLGLLTEVWAPSGTDTRAGAHEMADRLLPQVAELVRTLGADATYGTKPFTGVSLGAVGDEIAAHMLSLRLPLGPRVDADGTIVSAELGLATGIKSSDPLDGGIGGLVLVPSGEVDISGTGGAWSAGVRLAGSPGGLIVTKDGIVVPPGQSPELELEFTLARNRTSSGPAVLVGAAQGSHLAIGTVRVTLGATAGANEFSPRLGLDLIDAELVIKASDGDSFLRHVLPPGGLRVPLAFAMRWTPNGGVTFSGGATLEVDLPVDLDLVVLKIPVVHLALGVAFGPPAVRLGLGASAEVRLGPVQGVIEKAGVAFDLTFPPAGGNLGPAQLGVAFQPPKGIGLSVDAGPVKGGGYLFADYDKHEYAGLLHLEISDTIALTAVGLLQTRMPDGSDGFSLVVIVSAEFPAIQLGYGFTLNGVGGIIGINRTMNVPALQAGVRAGALGSILFPQDPVPRARQIVADIGHLFPPAAGQFVVGPMVKLGWGTPSILTATLAIVVEFPALRIALLGRVQLALPTESEAVVLLRLDIAGIVDVPGRQLSVDGTLDGSRVAVFTITGDLAVRARWGDQPDFAVSAGGFNPRYSPPATFPVLRRLSIALAAGDNPRLRLEAYFALTPATLQMGAHAELYAAIDTFLGFFELDAGAGFDALITFAPFGLIVDIGAHILLRRNGSPFCGVELAATLSGPEPWEVDGTVTVHFLGTHDLHVHHRFGFPRPVPPVAAVPIAARVRAALGDPRNWSAQSGAETAGVRLRERSAEEPPAAHPLGRLGVRQTLAPLGARLEKVGEAPIAGEATLRIGSVTVGAAQVDAAQLQPTTEQFAPAQFFRRTDNQRLTLPAFERMQAGVDVGTADVHGYGARTIDLGYEDLEVREAAQPVALGIGFPGSTILEWAVKAGPAATHGIAARADRRYRGAFLGIEAHEDRWAVADPQAASRNSSLVRLESYATAAEAVAETGRNGFVVPRQETSA